MKAFIEVLSGIIRLGPDTNKYGDPFTHAVAFSTTDGETAVLKALVSSGDLSFSHYKAILRELRKLSLKPTWYRLT